MKTEAEIKKALREMEIREKSYTLDIMTKKEPGTVVYDTELIRKLEVTAATIHALRWVLHSPKPVKSKKLKP